ncbi:MAG TPA: alpha/beta fold hydrolase [Verrucomicrobiae bacterium]
MSGQRLAKPNKSLLWLALAFSLPASCWIHSLCAQTTPPVPTPIEERFHTLEQSLNFTDQQVRKNLDDVLWFRLLEDIARVDRIRYAGPAGAKPANPNPQGPKNSLFIPAYTFLPKKFHWGKLPLLVLVHGEVHGDFNTRDWAHVVRELVEQGYAVIAPDYRGSTGYGRDYFEMIDYGGLEVEDVFLAREWMVQNVASIDSKRVGILGWSHGGMITLLNIFQHSRSFQAAYTGMPVSDLELRVKYRGKPFQDLLAAPFHIGKTFAQDPDEYRRRSPVTYAAKLEIPLLVHGVSNDVDVKLMEIEKLAEALKNAGKSFESKIYTNAPGGHCFNLMDTSEAKDSRREVYRFLARYLRPPSPPK